MSESASRSLWVYRITHYKNLEHILENGMCIKDHEKFDPKYINIGNTGIIDTRKDFQVKINNYGYIGDYVPFYFGRQSIMLYNILNGTNVERQSPEDIIYLCCTVDKLAAQCDRYFFTDGQANKQFTDHYFDLDDLSKLDWDVINGSDFRYTEEDPDKKRRYQAEFLVWRHVPVNCIGAIVVYNQIRKDYVKALLEKYSLPIQVKTPKSGFYFHF